MIRMNFADYHMKIEHGYITHCSFEKSSALSFGARHAPTMLNSKD